MASTSVSQQLPIILYHYPYSPYAKRVIWYLQLRGIPYYQCVQPPILPRPDLTRLGINYRRIPILSIGRDVYLDSRLIISKLEQLQPPLSSPPLSTTTTTNNSSSSSNSTPEARTLEALLRATTIDGGIFASAAKLIPTNLPLTKDPKFQKDRADFFGTSRSQSSSPSSPSSSAQKEAAADALRAEALGDIRAQFELLETTLLADGREWVLGTKEKGPSLADIEAVWPLHWLVTGLPGALPADQISRERFPRVYGWIDRFSGAVAAAKKRAGKEAVKSVGGEEAERIIRESELHEPEGQWTVDGTQPIAQFHGLKRRRAVEVWPTDTGTGHRDRGVLVGLNAEEVVIEKEGGGAGGGGRGPVRVHVPRHGFRVKPVKEGSSNL